MGQQGLGTTTGKAPIPWPISAALRAPERSEERFVPALRRSATTNGIRHFVLPEILVSTYDQERENEGDMARPSVVQVTWNPKRPEEFEVYLTDASADSRPG